MTKNPPLDWTHTEDGSSDESVVPRAWLVYLGAAENGFADAGRLFPLDGLSKVRFGRSENPGQLENETADGVMYLGVPVGWVSGVHCEMRIVPRRIALHLDLQDLHSRNGTHIEGEPTDLVARLPVAAMFEVGRSFWMVQTASGSMAESMDRKQASLDLETVSPSLRHSATALERLAPSPVSVLLCGETGTGKKELARRIHRFSGRTGEFVCAHLGAFSANRLESLLFGETDGRGTLLERARGGTLFLENVGELSDDAQIKLRSAVVEVLPGCDVRLICSTVPDLRRMVESGKFRGDLYSRLAGFEVVLPALRERREDLGLLVRDMARSANGEPRLLTSRAFRRVLSARWPFNLRQLAQTLTATTILASEGGRITRDLLDEVLRGGGELPQAPEEVLELHQRLIQELSDHAGDVTAVAEALGRERREIDHWLARFDLAPGAYRH